MLRELRLGLVSRLSRGLRGDEAADQDVPATSQDGAAVAGVDDGPVDLAPPPPVPAPKGAQVRRATSCQWRMSSSTG